MTSSGTKTEETIEHNGTEDKENGGGILGGILGGGILGGIDKDNIGDILGGIDKDNLSGGNILLGDIGKDNIGDGEGGGGDNANPQN